MNSLQETAPAFVKMAHRIVWCSAASVDTRGRPRSRILHPIWHWDGQQLVGWVITGPASPKRAQIEANPFVSLNYWAPDQDTCVADCRAEFSMDDAVRARAWDMFVQAPPPLGYDPRIIPGWTGPTSPNVGVLRLTPWHLRVFPGTMLMGQGGPVLSWSARARG